MAWMMHTMGKKLFYIAVHWGQMSRSYIQKGPKYQHDRYSELPNSKLSSFEDLDRTFWGCGRPPVPAPDEWAPPHRADRSPLFRKTLKPQLVTLRGPIWRLVGPIVGWWGCGDLLQGAIAARGCQSLKKASRSSRMRAS